MFITFICRDFISYLKKLFFEEFLIIIVSLLWIIRRSFMSEFYNFYQFKYVIFVSGVEFAQIIEFKFIKSDVFCLNNLLLAQNLYLINISGVITD